MIHNGHTPNIEAMPKSKTERAAEAVLHHYRVGEIDLSTTFEKLLDMVARLGRSVTHLWQENLRLTSRNAYLEAEIERTQRRLQHMNYTPRYLSQGEIDAFARGQYVYVLHDVEVTGRFKIGKATLPRARFTEYTKWPFRWQVVCILPTKDMHTLERRLHQQYQHKRVPNSEWFTLNTTDVLDIITYTE